MSVMLNTFMIDEYPQVVITQAADPRSIASGAAVDPWREIEASLRRFKRDAKAFEEEGDIPPTASALGTAFHLLNELKERNAPPTRVAPDRDGGLIFERRQDRSYESFEIDHVGNIELVVVKDGKVTKRQAISRVRR